MLELIGDPHNLPFTVALGVMLMLALLQVVGLGDLLDGDADLDGAPDIDAGLLSVLGLGRLPFLMWLMLLLAVFGLLGLAGQQFVTGLTGTRLSVGLAAIGAGLASLPLTGMLARPLGRLVPRDETTAIERAALVGREARIVIGTAARGSPARGQVRDQHGQDHYVMVEPHHAEDRFAQGDRVLLVRVEDEVFYGISRDTVRLLQAD